MPRYSYTVKDPQGKTINEITEAYDKNSLVQQLQGKGLFIIKVEEVPMGPAPVSTKSKGGKKSKVFTHKKVKLDDLISFARQLTTMLEAGVTLLRSLEVITQQSESEKLFDILSEVNRDVEQGSSLSQALEKHPKIFNQFWVSLIEVGEASGTMPMVLSKLSFYLEQQAAFKSTIVSAIMYPVILLFICLGAVTFFALVVGPRFENVFNSMDIELPLITRALLGLFRFIKEKFILIIVFTSVSTFLFKKWAKTRKGRLQIEKILFGMPVVGKIVKLIVVERFTSQMAILVESGVPILYALDISERLVNNITCALIIADIKERVREGELLVAPMERSHFFPPMAIQMINVGEETGELSKMLGHVAHYYQDVVETFMKRLGTVIEPFMLVFMGAIIGIIVLAMFLPMFNISQLSGAGG